VAEIVDEISSSEYAIDDRLSRFRWMPDFRTAELSLIQQFPLLT
jgi:hypothetical protein